MLASAFSCHGCFVVFARPVSEPFISVCGLGEKKVHFIFERSGFAALVC